MVPKEQDRIEVHRVIYDELCQGKVLDSSKQTYMQIIEGAQHADAPADGVIFACTEIGLLITPDDFSFPAFDTTVLHAEAALTFAGISGCGVKAPTRWVVFFNPRPLVVFINSVQKC